MTNQDLLDLLKGDLQEISESIRAGETTGTERVAYSADGEIPDESEFKIVEFDLKKRADDLRTRIAALAKRMREEQRKRDRKQIGVAIESADLKTKTFGNKRELRGDDEELTYLRQVKELVRLVREAEGLEPGPLRITIWISDREADG